LLPWDNDTRAELVLFVHTTDTLPLPSTGDCALAPTESYFPKLSEEAEEMRHAEATDKDTELLLVDSAAPAGNANPNPKANPSANSSTPKRMLTP
jgi:hypothetical protein